MVSVRRTLSFEGANYVGLRRVNFRVHDCIPPRPLPARPLPTLPLPTRPLSKPKMHYMEALYNNHLVYDSVLCECNGRDLLRLMRTCKAFERMVRDFMRRAYDLNKHLLSFFMDPLSFRCMQWSTGAIISGSFALQFFTRSYYPAADLDIYVCLPGGIRAGNWLQSNGYVYVPACVEENGTVFKQPNSFEHAVRSMDFAWAPDRFYCEGVDGVFNFEKVVCGCVRKVQIIVTGLCPIKTILNFHSSKLYVFYQSGADYMYCYQRV